MVQIKRSDGQQHHRAKNGTRNELERAPLHKTQGQPEHVIHRIGMFAQFVNIFDTGAALHYKIERLIGERLHHRNQATLESVLGAVNVHQNAAQVEKAGKVIGPIRRHNRMHHVRENGLRVFFGATKRKTERAATRLGRLRILLIFRETQAQSRPHQFHNGSTWVVSARDTSYFDRAENGRETVEPVHGQTLGSGLRLVGKRYC